MRSFTLVQKLMIFLVVCALAIVSSAIFWQFTYQKPAVKVTKAFSPSPTSILAEKFRDDLLLPDLAIKKPTQLYIVAQTAKKTLRFNTTFVNLGPGPLEVLGHSDPTSNLTYASQYIFAQGAPGEYRNIGNFEFHPTHRHWHITDHVSYQLWSLGDLGMKKDLIADTGKMSFCLWDENPNDLKMANASQTRVYGFTCTRNSQGMSVGWSDTYAAKTDGQELNITNITDGDYILRFEVNPKQRIFETDYSNNAGEIKIRISKNLVTIL